MLAKTSGRLVLSYTVSGRINWESLGKVGQGESKKLSTEAKCADATPFDAEHFHFTFIPYRETHRTGHRWAEPVYVNAVLGGAFCAHRRVHLAAGMAGAEANVTQMFINDFVYFHTVNYYEAIKMDELDLYVTM